MGQKFNSQMMEFGNGILGKSGPAPDYTAAAEKTAQGNRINQSNPYSSVTFNPDGSQSTTFAPGMQNSFDRLQQQFNDAWAKPMDDGSGARDQAINAAYGQAESRLNPQWQQRQQSMAASLANQGLDPNSEAARNANQTFSNERNDAYSSAMNSAIGLGNQAQDLTFRQNMSARMAPLQGMQGMQGFLNQSGYNSGPDYLRAAGMTGQYNQQEAQNRSSAFGDLLSGGGQIGKAAALSDERAKEDVHRYPMEAAPGVPLASFKYKGKPGKYFGVIAQDLEAVAPDQVTEGRDGMKHVPPQFKPFKIR